MTSAGRRESTAADARGVARDLAAAVAGLLLPLAFSPHELWLAALVAPATLYWACLQGSSRRLALRGFAFGLASFGAGVSWIHESFQFSNVALPFAIVLTAGFVAFLSIYPALASALFGRAFPAPVRRRPAAAVAFAGLYVLAEWLRGWLFSGFTWLQLGYSQVDGPFASLLPLGGVYGTGALLASGATIAVAAWQWRPRMGVLVATLLAGAAAITGVLLPTHWTEAAGEPIRVAIVQGNVPQDQKWLPSMRAPTLERYLSLTRAHLDDTLVVWPETSIPAARDRIAPFLDQLRQEAIARGGSVLVGLPEVNRSTGATFNTSELLGRSNGVYRKRHLVPFGEFLPVPALLRPLTRALGIPVSDFSPGDGRQPVLRHAGHAIAIFICYEIAFGAEVAARLPEARLLVTISNDAWFGDSVGPVQHLQMARARALETGRFLVRATNTGLSAVVNPSGEVVLELPQLQVADGATVVVPMSGVTPYVRMGDPPVLVLCLIGVIGGRLGCRPPRDRVS